LLWSSKGGDPVQPSLTKKFQELRFVEFVVHTRRHIKLFMFSISKEKHLVAVHKLVDDAVFLAVFMHACTLH